MLFPQTCLSLLTCKKQMITALTSPAPQEGNSVNISKALALVLYAEVLGKQLLSEENGFRVLSARRCVVGAAPLTLQTMCHGSRCRACFLVP